MKKFCIGPGQNRVFTAYQVRGLLQNRQRRQKGVHKMFTFQAGQNRVFAAYQVREKFFEIRFPFFAFFAIVVL